MDDYPCPRSGGAPGHVPLFHFDTIDSTNEAAKRLIREGRIAGQGYVLARGQTAGKGQRGRTWSSPRDAGIYLSVVDRPASRHADLGVYTRAAGVACAIVLAKTAGVDVRIKPINDLYVERRKLGGILTEAIIERGELCALVTGVGVNLRKADHQIPRGAALPISLQELLSPDRFAYLDAEQLTASLVSSILCWNARLREGQVDVLEVEWSRLRLDDGSPMELCDAQA